MMDEKARADGLQQQIGDIMRVVQEYSIPQDFTQPEDAVEFVRTVLSRLKREATLAKGYDEC